MGFSSKAKGLLFVGIAVLCGLIAMLVVFSIGGRVAPSVPALQAERNIQPGDPLGREMFTEVMLAEANLPPGLVDTDIDFSHLIAARTISEGDILRDVDLMALEEPFPALFSARLRAFDDPDLRAVEVPVEAVRGLITGMGYKDYIDIIAVYEDYPDDAFEDIPEEFEGVIRVEKELISKTILHSVPVVGLRAGGQEGLGGREEIVLVVALIEEDAETLALYRETGKLYASLRPFGKIDPVPEEVELPDYQEDELEDYPDDPSNDLLENDEPEDDPGHEEDEVEGDADQEE